MIDMSSTHYRETTVNILVLNPPEFGTILVLRATEKGDFIFRKKMI